MCLSSAYRSYNEQTYLFNRKVSQCGGDEAAAARIVNRPGTSEHQLGLCADITDKFYESRRGSSKRPRSTSGCTPTARTTASSCATPPTSRTSPASCMSRALPLRRKEAAAYIMGNGLCLEEFLDLYK